jgi:hypothetical protein
MKRREFIISEKCLQNGALPFLFGFADRHCPRAFVGIRTRHRELPRAQCSEAVSRSAACNSRRLAHSLRNAASSRSNCSVAAVKAASSSRSTSRLRHAKQRSRAYCGGSLPGLRQNEHLSTLEGLAKVQDPACAAVKREAEEDWGKER